jgi:hypothetical protein
LCKCQVEMGQVRQARDRALAGALALAAGGEDKAAAQAEAPAKDKAPDEAKDAEEMHRQAVRIVEGVRRCQVETEQARAAWAR